MKKQRSILIWIIITVVIISLGMSIAALVIANSDVRGDCEMVYNFTKLVEFTGTVFSIVGVIWTVYFVIVGINVVNVQKKIQSTSENIEKYQSEMESNLKSFTKELYSIYQSLFIIVNDLGQSIPNSENRNKNIEKAKKNLQLIKSRLGVNLKYLSEDERIEDIKYVFENGDDSDLENLNIIIEDSSETKRIKDYINILKNTRKQFSQKKDSFVKRVINAITSVIKE